MSNSINKFLTIFEGLRLGCKNAKLFEHYEEQRVEWNGNEDK